MNKKLSRLFSPNMLLYFIVLAVFCGLSWFFSSRSLAVIELVISAALIVYYGISWYFRRKDLTRYIEDTTLSFDAVSNDRMPIPLPAAILNIGEVDIMWCNDAFLQIAGSRDSLFEVSLSDIFPDVSIDWLLNNLNENPDDVEKDGRRYRMYGSRFQDKNGHSETAIIYLVDSTELLDSQDEFQMSRPVVCIIYVDNYDELAANQPDSSVSGLSAQLDETIYAWASSVSGIIRKLERNRYLFLFEERYLQQLIDNKFSVLDSVRNITNGVGAPATLSIGVGRDGETLRASYEFANLCIDMALSRGGDQAVMKDRYDFTFYGGRLQETDRRTMVKSRVVANSLADLISQSERVFIMGHKNADNDAVGAAAGVLAICRKLGKLANIVIDLENNASHPLIDKLLEDGSYHDVFLSPADALLADSSGALLVVVDTNRPSQVESATLLESCSRVAVIDHHRRAADYIEGALLNFHEPYASSACELVTELVQCLLERDDIYPSETLALLAGIVLDTKNFTVRTGGRTFEAAAWLRKHKADTVEVKLLFQNDLSATLRRYDILQHAMMYKYDVALCELDYTTDRVTAAQAADELLNISGIQASFVYYPDGDRVICSGRSIGEANAQMILEPLGGGGNQATAGAQITGMTPQEVTEALKQSIDAFFAD